MSHYARIVPKRPRTPFPDLEPSKRVRLHNHPDTGGISTLHTSTGDIGSIPDLRCQGQNPLSGRFPSLPDHDFWLWSYGWELFQDPFFHDGSREDPEIPVILLKSTIIDVDDESTLQIQRNCFGGVVPFMSVL